MRLEELKTFKKVDDHIHKVTQRFLETGVAYFEIDWTDKTVPSLIQGPSMRAYMRMVAKEMRRPFIHARRIQWNPRGNCGRDRSRRYWMIELTVPKLERFDDLVTPFLLCAAPGENKYSGRQNPEEQPAVLTAGENKTTRSFNFFGEQGEAVFLGWLNRCRTDKVYRAILGM